MDKFKLLVDEWAARVGTKVRTEPTNVVHLPSFLLGCFVTVMIFSLVPVMKLFLGSLLLTTITVLKYLVIGGGVIACVMVITSRNGEDTNKIKSLRHGKPPELPSRKEIVAKGDPEVAPQQLLNTMVYPIDDGSGLVKDDFEMIKHYDIPLVKSRHHNRRKIPTDERAYNSFINRAAMKKVDG